MSRHTKDLKNDIGSFPARRRDNNDSAEAEILRRFFRRLPCSGAYVGPRHTRIMLMHYCRCTDHVCLFAIGRMSLRKAAKKTKFKIQ